MHTHRLTHISPASCLSPCPLFVFLVQSSYISALQLRVSPVSQHNIHESTANNWKRLLSSSCFLAPTVSTSMHLLHNASGLRNHLVQSRSLAAHLSLSKIDLFFFRPQRSCIPCKCGVCYIQCNSSCIDLGDGLRYRSLGRSTQRNYSPR